MIANVWQRLKSLFYRCNCCIPYFISKWQIIRIHFNWASLLIVFCMVMDSSDPFAIGSAGGLYCECPWCYSFRVPNEIGISHLVWHCEDVANQNIWICYFTYKWRACVCVLCFVFCGVLYVWKHLESVVQIISNRSLLKSL